MAGMKRRDARALDHKTLQEIRIRAVERVQAGESPEAVIQALGFTRSCIYTWLARYRSGGWGALKARALKGRPMKINAPQMRWLYRTVRGKSPLQFRFEFALWTREMIRVLLREQFDLPSLFARCSRAVDHRLDEPRQIIPQHDCVLAAPASVSPGAVIVAPEPRRGVAVQLDTLVFQMTRRAEGTPSPD
jgi:transposase